MTGQNSAGPAAAQKAGPASFVTPSQPQPDRAKRVHFLGIGGSGLSPLAQIHLAGGGEVSGSDQEDSARVAMLRALGIAVRVGPPADPATLATELRGADVIVASSALRDDHPEIVAARALGIPVMRRSDWLPELTAAYRLVAVAGSHGKTTTAAMLTLVLRAAGVDPTAVIGAEVAQLGGSAVAGTSDVFVLEADEYGGAFAGLDPELAVITNVEWEHPDLFPDEASVHAVFTDFAARVRPGGRLVVCGDHPGVAAVLARLDQRAAAPDQPRTAPDQPRATPEQPGPDQPRTAPDQLRATPDQTGPTLDQTGAAARARVVDYGFAAGRTWQAVGYTPRPGGGSVSTVWHDGVEVGELALALPGPHVALNALAALATSAELGVAPETALRALGTFSGAARRFDTVGQAITAGGTAVEIVDDYAHHPTEIRATLRAARDRAAGRQVWAVTQPHTFSRLAALLDDFATAFEDADRVYVTDIYAARETDDLGLHATDLAKRISRPRRSDYVSWPELLDRLLTDLDAAADDVQGDRGVLLLTLGAGTITTVGPLLLDRLRRPGDHDQTPVPDTMGQIPRTRPA
ncbi:UDP-N-acetylmuramate--alanine ligase [Frankia sp. CcI49]|uniref:UDP-N-acetylmuramate--L-alanine ligase n=1 Tax=Frankia sp. CcI49 TaxID=1745382 RepID=UPI000977038B|nr:Mur ligase domain-containing protein [Frankia sp. CcI49]ONH62273.1 UDP-N-acetylmuramate--alanine ligase [Frankia sp. CcI49]